MGVRLKKEDKPMPLRSSSNFNNTPGRQAFPRYTEKKMDSERRGDSAEVTQPVGGIARGFSLAFVAPQDPAHNVDLSQACSGGNSPLLLSKCEKVQRTATKKNRCPQTGRGKRGAGKECWVWAAAVGAVLSSPWQQREAAGGLWAVQPPRRIGAGKARNP